MRSERSRGSRRHPHDVSKPAAAIVEGVRLRGDAALLEYTAKFDSVALEACRGLPCHGEIDAP